jgi:hypothetical protein
MNYVKKNRNSYFVVCSERLFPVLVGVIKLQYFSSGKFGHIYALVRYAYRSYSYNVYSYTH